MHNFTSLKRNLKYYSSTIPVQMLFFTKIITKMVVYANLDYENGLVAHKFLFFFQQQECNIQRNNNNNDNNYSKWAKNVLSIITGYTKKQNPVSMC